MTSFLWGTRVGPHARINERGVFQPQIRCVGDLSSHTLFGGVNSQFDDQQPPSLGSNTPKHLKQTLILREFESKLNPP